jgi:hypothetical protein
LHHPIYDPYSTYFTSLYIMPQPAFEVKKYLSAPLPQIREQYPPGTGGTGPRATWDGNLKGVEVIDDLDEKVKQCMSRSPAIV